MGFYDYKDDKRKKDYNNYGEKPKNDFQYDNSNGIRDASSYIEPERGGCLTAFLIYLTIVNFIVVFITFGLSSEVSSSAYRSSSSLLTAIVCFQFVLSAAAFASIYGLWNWKSWGYYGLLGLYGLNAAISLFTGQLSFVGSLVNIGILIMLMQDKTYYLD